MAESTPKIENKAEADELAGTEAPLLEHLIELRKRLIWSLVAFSALFVACFFVSKEIYLFLIGPFRQAVGEGGTVER
ncbi:MAG: twin-arginine translocase subunit TatC, partial [Alphaproteobacteria bacterium]|nr:twin-arginine translocase subunit TatC [Alphaproteobacteria bacterium]